MDKLIPNILPLINRYKYVLIVIFAGLLLMLLPGKQETVAAPETTLPKVQTIQEQLEEILPKIYGVGRVEVLLTQAQGERTVYVSDEHSSLSEDSDSYQADTVIITDESRAQKGLVSQVLPPVYLGAVIVCQGGDQPSVKLAVVEAVCDATGLSADKITVLKMK